MKGRDKFYVEDVKKFKGKDKDNSVMCHYVFFYIYGWHYWL